MLNSKILNFLLIVGGIILLNGCGGGSGGDQNVTTSLLNSNLAEEENNIPPTVNAGTDVKAQINKPITIIGIARDSDGEISSIEWSKNGEVLATTLKFSYMPTMLGIDALTLTVVDNDGASATDSMDIQVLEEYETHILPF